MRWPRSLHLAFALLLCLCLTLPSMTAQADPIPPRYRLTDLGAIAPLGIDNQGNIVGQDGSRAVIRRADGGTTYLRPPSDESLSWANTSPGGTIVHTLLQSTPDGSGVTTRSALIQNGQETDLGSMLPPGKYDPGTLAVTNAVNDRGDIAGFVGQFLMQRQAFISTDQQGEGRQIFLLGSPENDSLPTGINARGQAVGYTTSADGVTHAFQAVVVGGVPTMTDLGTLGGLHSNANGINDAGQVVGGSNVPDAQAVVPPATDDYPAVDPTQIRHAFLFENGKMKDLGILPGDYSSEALAINNHGQIVGVSETLDPFPGPGHPGAHAFLYADRQMYDLNGLLTTAPDWTLEEASGINDRGQIIGHGTYWAPENGGPEDHYFLLTPDPVPEPTTLALFAVSGLALVARRALRSRRAARGSST